MFQILVEDSVEWPTNGTLKLPEQLLSSTENAISPEMARRKANGYLGMHVVFFSYAGTPKLLLSKRPLWRMPIILRLRGFGDVAILGQIDVDAQTGTPIRFSEDEIEEIQARAEKIAERLTLPATAGQ